MPRPIIIVAFKQHKYTEARHHLQETVSLLDELRDQRAIADALDQAAVLAHANGYWEQAAQFFAASDTLRETLDVMLPIGSGMDRENMLAALRAHLDAATFAAAWEAGRRMTLDEALVAAQNAVLAVPTGECRPTSAGEG